MPSPELVVSTYVLLALLVSGILILVIRGARSTKSLSDYALGNVGFSPAFVGLSLAASVTSAATFIINPGFIALYGISGVLALGIVLPIGLFISLVILTKSFRKYGQTTKALTMAQWIGKRYGSQSFSILFGFLSLLLITFVVLICVGMTKVLSQALGAPELVVLISLVVFVFGYMMFGGANSMVYTNTIQAVLMIIVAAVLLGSGAPFLKEGVGGMLTQLTAIDPNLASWSNPGSFLFRDYWEIILCNFIVGIAIVCQPHIITKSLLLKEDQQVNRYLTVAIATMALFFLVVIAGLYARLTFPDLTDSAGAAIPMDGIIPAYVVEAFPVYMGILVILGLMAAGLSTLEGLVQSVPMSITSDIIQPLFGKYLKATGNGRDPLILINKIVIAVVAVVSILLSWNQLQNPSLSVGIFAQNGVYAYFSAAFIPVLMGIFLKNVPVAAPMGASITAIVVHFAVYYGRLGPYMQADVRNPAVASATAIVLSTVVGFALYAMLKPSSQPSISNAA